MEFDSSAEQLEFFLNSDTTVIIGNLKTVYLNIVFKDRSVYDQSVSTWPLARSLSSFLSTTFCGHARFKKWGEALKYQINNLRKGVKRI